MPNLHAPLQLDPLRVGEVMRRAGYPRGEQYAADFARLLPLAGLSTPLRMGHLLSQIAIESDRFKATAEYASGDAYEGRKDLGNTRPGDGRRYKGHGLLQTTGRYNHRRVTIAIRDGFGCFPADPDAPDFEAEPTQLAVRPWCVLSALVFWHENKLAAVSDEGDTARVCARISRGVNRGSVNSTKPANGEAERIKAFCAFMAAITTVFASEVK